LENSIYSMLDRPCFGAHFLIPQSRGVAYKGQNRQGSGSGEPTTGIDFLLPGQGGAVSCGQMADGKKKKPLTDDSARKEAHSKRGSANQAVQRLLAAAEFRSTDRVLEVACGKGALAVEIARLAGYITGVDYSAELLAAAQDRVLQSGADNLSFQQIEGSHLPFEDATFDVVVCLGALHLLADPGRMLKEMVRVLKSPGRLCVADTVGAEDKAMREAHLKIEQARHHAAATIFTPSGFRGLIAVEPMEIVAHAHWSERLGFEQWMSLSEVSESKRDKVSRMLIAAAKKKTTDLKIKISGKAIAFEQHWELIVAEKTGGV